MRRSSIFTLTLPWALLASCSGERPDPFEGEQFDSDRDVGVEEREAARTLSLVDSGQITDVDPFEKAQRCSVAIGVLAESVEGLGTFTAEQLKVLADAKAVYDQRMRSESTAAVQPPGPVDTEPQDRDGSEASEQARRAIACLRELGLR